MNWNDYLQTFREESGLVICVKMGYIAVDIPIQDEVKEVKIVGTSSKNEVSYYDVELDGEVRLHIFRWASRHIFISEVEPYYFEKYPL